MFTGRVLTDRTPIDERLRGARDEIPGFKACERALYVVIRFMTGFLQFDKRRCHVPKFRRNRNTTG